MALLPSQDQASSTSHTNPALPTLKTCQLTRLAPLESTSLEHTKAAVELDLASIKLAQAQASTKAEPAQPEDPAVLSTRAELPTKAEPTKLAQLAPPEPTKQAATNHTNPVLASPAATNQAPTAPQPPAQAAQVANRALVNTNPPTNTRRNEQ